MAIRTNLTTDNEELISEQLQRYRYLLTRRDAELLTLEEQAELIAICDRLEVLNVSRLEKLSDLARLRGVSLHEIMD